MKRTAGNKISIIYNRCLLIRLKKKEFEILVAWAFCVNLADVCLLWFQQKVSRIWGFASMSPKTPSSWGSSTRTLMSSWRATSWALAGPCSPNTTSSCPKMGSSMRQRWVSRLVWSLWCMFPSPKCLMGRGAGGCENNMENMSCVIIT